MKPQLLIAAMACCLPVVSNVARAQAKAMDVYVSDISVAYPDPAGVKDPFKSHMGVVNITFGVVAPKGQKFVKNQGDTTIDTTDAAGGGQKAKINLFFTRLGGGGEFAKFPLVLEKMPVFPLKLDGVVKMKVSEGTKELPAQAFEVKNGAKFKVENMEVTVKDVTGQGLSLEFKDTLNVDQITLTDEKGGKLDAQNSMTSSFGSTRTKTYQVKNMPAKMKAVFAVSKGVKTVDVPMKMTVDLNNPAK